MSEAAEQTGGDLKLLLNLAIRRLFLILLSEVSGEYKKPDLGSFICEVWMRKEEEI